MKVLIVVDMQNDFISGALGSKEARAIVPKVVEKIERRKEEGYEVVFTLDTHGKDYLNTNEGRHLPVVHCVENTDGWRLEKSVAAAAEGCKLYKKPTFGSVALMEDLKRMNPQSIELIGLCTDICVISNALAAKAFLPESEITVDSACCAGVSPKKHEAALETMRSCLITVE